MEILETFPQEFCFPKTRINENSSNTCQARFILRRYSMQLFIYCVVFVQNALDTQWVSAILIHGFNTNWFITEVSNWWYMKPVSVECRLNTQMHTENKNESWRQEECHGELACVHGTLENNIWSRPSQLIQGLLQTMPKHMEIES